MHKKGCQSENIPSIKAGIIVGLHVGAESEIFDAMRESQAGGQYAKLGAECCPYITIHTRCFEVKTMTSLVPF
jgi:hypothetical protein